MEADSTNLQAQAHAGNSPPRCWALILAGGLGLRFGSDRPKGFVDLAGRPLLHWSLLAFARHQAVSDLLVVVPRGWEGAFREQVLTPVAPLLGDQATKIRGVVPGGEHRQDSVRLGLKAADELWRTGEEVRRSRVAEALGPSTGPVVPTAAPASGPPAPAPEQDPAAADPLVLVHDAARPLVPRVLIDTLLECLQVALEALRTPPATKGARRRKKKAKEPCPPAVIPVVPVGETLKALDESRKVTETVARAGLWRAQTPQAFQLHTLLDLHEQALQAGYAATDDAMLYEWRGWPVLTVPGSPLNLKMTFPEEAALLGAWLARHGGEAPEGEMSNRGEG